MPFSGTTFTKLYSWLTDPQRNEKIFNSRLDDELGGISTGLTTIRSSLTASSIAGSNVHGDADVTLTAADVPFTQLNAGLTAARTWTLPVSTSLPLGSFLAFADDGGIAGANTLKFTIQGTDVLQGVGVSANTLTLTHTSGSAFFMCSSGAWHVIATT